MIGWAILAVIVLCFFALYGVETRLGSHPGLYHPELGFDAEQGKLAKLSATEFACQLVPLLLSIAVLLALLAQIN